MKKKFLFITLILTLILSVFIACKDNNDSSSNLGNGNNKYAVLNDTYLQTDFENALAEIGAEESKMSALTKVEDWAGGSKYKFTYANKMTLYVYCNMTSTVDSINYGDEKIYYRGYESYNINNYVYDDSYEYTLVFASEDYVKLYLNYPSTAKFPASNSWSIYRYNDIYMLSSWVKASNAFGVESQYDFTTGFYVTEAEIKCIYLNIAGETKLNNVNQYKSTTERTQVEPKYPNKNSNGNAEGINLVYGQLGVYGKNENDNGYSYIAYYVPSGRYIVINNGNMGTIFVSNDNDTHTYNFASGSTGETKEITIPSGYYIELSIYTNITLQRVENSENSNFTSNGLKYLLSEDNTYYIISGYAGNNLKIRIPDKYNEIPVKKIGIEAFKNSSITNIEMPETIVEIGNSAFYESKDLQEVAIPDSVVCISDYAFYNCSSLTSVTIGNKTTTIGDAAFNSCFSLTKVNYTGTLDSWAQIEFASSCANPLSYAKILYLNDILVTEAIFNTATKISNYSFYNCSLLTSVVIGDNVISIDNDAFYNCNSLISAILGVNVVSIGCEAFYNCCSLISIEIPNSVTDIDSYAFAGCSKLASVTIPQNVTSIGKCAFGFCSNLTSIIFEDTSTWYSISSLDNNAIENWQNKTWGSQEYVANASDNANTFKFAYNYYWYKI